MRRGLNAGRLGSVWWRRGPLITPDANVVAHVVWRNGALVDTIGNSWTMNGTVPQVASAGAIPPGAGPFTAANYYSLGAGADVLDLATPFSVFVVARLVVDSSILAPMVSNTDNVSTGYRLSVRQTTGVIRFSSFNDLNTGNAITVGRLFVACGGNPGGGVERVQLNSGSVVQGPGVYAVDAATPARIGYDPAGPWTFNGYIYEVYITTTTPTGAFYTSVVQQVASRMKMSL